VIFISKNKSSSGMDIPDYAYKALASCLLPIIQKYYKTDEGKKAFKEWKENKE
jgi:hypothetical protein